jgi:hypothetical protein
MKTKVFRPLMLKSKPETIATHYSVSFVLFVVKPPEFSAQSRNTASLPV